MYRGHLDISPPELALHAIRTVTRTCKDNDLLPFRMRFQKIAQEIVLVALVNAHHVLAYLVNGRPFWRDRNLHRIVHQLAGKLAYLRRKRRREEHRMAYCRKFSDNAPDIGEEPHVKHAVCLVEDEFLDAVEIHDALRHQVYEPARRRHDHLGATLKILHLQELRHAAEHYRIVGTRVFRVVHEVVGSLGGKLASWREHERARMACAFCRAWRLRRRTHQPVQDRQQERGCLAGTSLGATNEVTPFHQVRYRLLLDRSWRFIADFDDGLAEALVEHVKYASHANHTAAMSPRK